MDCVPRTYFENLILNMLQDKIGEKLIKEFWKVIAVSSKSESRVKL
jgi:hypothetical protein